MDAPRDAGDVVAVGDGRGFVLDTASGYFVVTAAHCLDPLPPCGAFLGPSDRTYKGLVGKIGSDERVWVECLFADLVGDIAVLGPPEDPFGETLTYRALLETVKPFTVSAAPPGGPARLIGLDGQWFPCNIERDFLGRICIKDNAKFIAGGMSGSPICLGTGSAIGVLTTGVLVEDNEIKGPNPELTGNLPGWLLRELAVSDRH
jgi:hypothetical protein